ncbi:Gfo/Idh/MocA family protein [Limnohabitans sp. B9-3]|uniref:Gfo/Idh/MocA family protein n=1 Tax=Limnohabitans sp. B9-3 TaxID=1100707 RepID=UPI000C1DDBFA|nr:Gfo/Idh/MocA family oxidoreductase [Limnohabitans sp. B9-3]PIT77553.1 oxidoreductase [Limnohabitans sp. B9-3]
MTQPTQQTLRLGILGCANIAKQFARDVAGTPQVAIHAVASRDLAKAQAFAQQFQIARAHGSYDALLADNALDAVYVPLPNSLHAEWAIRAMQAGKHVLCEKPLALNLSEVTRMYEVARQHGVMLLESYPYWFQPQTRDMLACLSLDKIGEVRSMQASFGFSVGNPDTNIRMKPDLGGGALLDAGSYPISLIRLVMGCAPERVVAHATWASTGVDISMMATLFYADGRRAQMSCAMDTANHRRATIVGSHGTVETEYLNHTSNSHTHAWGYLPSQLRVRQGIANSIAFEEVHSATGSGFQFAAEAFAQVVREGDITAIERAASASHDIAATLDAIQESAKKGQLVTLRQ